MRTTYIVDWYDERGDRHRRSFDDAEVASEFERKTRSRVLILLAGIAGRTNKQPRRRRQKEAR